MLEDEDNPILFVDSTNEAPLCRTDLANCNPEGTLSRDSESTLTFVEIQNDTLLDWVAGAFGLAVVLTTWRL